jgi:hypothetical protein
MPEFAGQTQMIMDLLSQEIGTHKGFSLAWHLIMGAAKIVEYGGTGIIDDIKKFEHDYITTHTVPWVQMTGELRNYDILKMKVAEGERKYGQNLSFDDVENGRLGWGFFVSDKYFRQDGTNRVFKTDNLIVGSPGTNTGLMYPGAPGATARGGARP